MEAAVLKQHDGAWTGINQLLSLSEVNCYGAWMKTVWGRKRRRRVMR